MRLENEFDNIFTDNFYFTFLYGYLVYKQIFPKELLLKNKKYYKRLIMCIIILFNFLIRQNQITKTKIISFIFENYNHSRISLKQYFKIIDKIPEFNFYKQTFRLTPYIKNHIIALLKHNNLI